MDVFLFSDIYFEVKCHNLMRFRIFRKSNRERRKCRQPYKETLLFAHSCFTHLPVFISMRIFNSDSFYNCLNVILDELFF